MKTLETAVINHVRDIFAKEEVESNCIYRIESYNLKDLDVAGSLRVLIRVR